MNMQPNHEPDQSKINVMSACNLYLNNIINGELLITLLKEIKKQDN
jgi:hypothetical protein